MGGGGTSTFEHVGTLLECILVCEKEINHTTVVKIKFTVRTPSDFVVCMLIPTHLDVTLHSCFGLIPVL